MGVKLFLVLVLLLLAAAAVPHSATFNDDAVFASGGDLFGDMRGRGLRSGGFRPAARGGRFLSYDALKKNAIPCGWRGRSYFDCSKRKRVNPYRRSCIYMTGCARFTD